MPIHEYRCTCGHITEELVPVADIPSTIRCERCGRTAPHIISPIARTPNRWGETNGRIIPALGGWVGTSQDEERLMKERGLHRTADHTTDFIDTQLDRQQAMYDLETEEARKLESLQSTGMDEDTAASTLFTPEYLEARATINPYAALTETEKAEIKDIVHDRTPHP